MFTDFDIEPKKCEVCGGPATLHQTEIENGAPVPHHYCERHGEPLWQASLPKMPAASEADLRRMVEEAKRLHGLGG